MSINLLKLFHHRKEREKSDWASIKPIKAAGSDSDVVHESAILSVGVAVESYCQTVTLCMPRAATCKACKHVQHDGNNRRHSCHRHRAVVTERDW